MKDKAPGWVVQCKTCGLKRSASEVGIIRIGARSKGKCVLGRCPRCERLRCHKLKREVDKS